MYRSNIFTLFLMVIIGFAPLFLTGCSSSDGGGNDNNGTGAQAAVIDEASVTEEMEFIEESIPGCDMVEATELAGGIMGWQRLRDPSGALVGLFATLTGTRSQTADYLASIDIGPMEIEGDCGGTMTIDSAHSNGTTTLTLVFNEFCTLDEASTPLEEIKINGRIVAKQIGTPSADGPIISSYTAETDGKLTVEAGGEKVFMTLDNFVYTLGSPGVEPGVPTLTSPDRISLDQLAVNFETRERVMTLTDLRAASYESGNDKVAEVNSGRFTMGDKGYVDVSTRQPVIIDSDGDVVSGAIDFAGAGGNVATVIVGDEPGKFILEINDQPMDQCMDCSDLDLDDIPLPLLQ